jgi:hypothetical protein
MNHNKVPHYKINNDYINNNSPDVFSSSNILNGNYSNNNEDDGDEQSPISIIMTIFIGLTVGIVLGYFIFRDVKYIGPDSNSIVKEIYIDEDGRKFKYKPRITICPLNYSMNKLHDENYKEHH